MTTINPLNTSEAIKETYSSYLKSLIKPKNAQVSAALEAAINQSIEADGGVVKGPFLEATPPYVAGQSIRDLVSQGVLSAEFLRLDGTALPIDRPLYAHQESAIRKLAAGRNILVATGTGSGKTESFLFPIINSLMEEKQTGNLGPGVRALLLYPMNALANDQVKRIREYLSLYPDITFGRYTGETPETEKRAKEAFLAAEGKSNLKNELISREQIRATPPNILLTNYAMLEYLLLRPNDVPLFEGASSNTWKFIVADEAHTYDGAHGIEVATLLRKLRERVDTELKIQTIGTTATIGENIDAIQKFAINFFNNKFEMVGESEADSDLVRPQRKPIAEGSWGPLTVDQWNDLSDESQFINAFVEGGESAAHKFQTEASVSKLRNVLLNEPLAVNKCAEKVFGDTSEDALQAVSRIVNLGAAIKDESGNPALSARFHLFARATEGLFGCMVDSPHFSLSRRIVCDECDRLALELAGCSRCGASYYIGYEEVIDDVRYFKAEAFGKSANYISIGANAALDADEDDDLIDESSNQLSYNSTWHMCINCGRFDSNSFTTCDQCGSTEVRNIITHTSRKECTSCLSKGTQVIRKLESGNEAAASVLATELYQHMPPSSSPDQAALPGEGRKLMVFSDNRQQAAFFAPYLEQRYAKIMWRKVIYQGILETAQQHPAEDKFSLTDLVPAILALANRAKLFEAKATPITKRNQVLERLHFEAVNTEFQNNLEGIGLVSFSLEMSSEARAYAALDGLGLNDDECRLVVEELLHTLRYTSVMSAEVGVTLENELFKPRMGVFTMREYGNDPRRKISAWTPDPTKNRQNRRLSYLKRVLAKTAPSADASLVLHHIWESLTLGLLKDSLRSLNIQGVGIVRTLDHTQLRLKLVDEVTNIYRCESCGLSSSRNVRGVCPRFKCEGTLTEARSEIQKNGSFYGRQYKSGGLISMSAREHTAQLTLDEARDIQNDFIQGKVNVLSSSTTFELGVDVGELQSVFLRNVPPAVSNYLQRAGRAGRRADSAALILTYAQRKPHDLSKYGDPVSLVAGQMRAPYVELENERILQRHMYSVFFSAYFQSYSIDNTVKAGTFFLTSATPHSEQMSAWVHANAVALQTRFNSIAPDVLKPKAVQIWARTLSDFTTLLANVKAKFADEILEYTSLIDAATAKGGAKALFEAANLTRIKDNILSTDMISFLSKNNLIPKYGFPVDTVTLSPRRSEAHSEKVDLDRDLSIAIFEYAPGSSIVAAGYLWQSIGLGHVPNKEFQRMQYAKCPICDHYNQQIANQMSKLSTCQSCSSPLPKISEYVIPEWGFIASGGSTRPGETLKPSAGSRELHLAKNGLAVHVEGQKTPGHRVTAQLRTIAELVLINSGQNASGYYLCPSCKASVPGSAGKMEAHDRPYKEGSKCSQKFVVDKVHLGHQFQTDIVTVTIDMTGTGLDPKGGGQATAYALLEGASAGLQIAHDDIDVICLPSSAQQMNIALVDAVPAGAGFAKLIAENLVTVFNNAYDRMNTCECGEDTSCYECLRSYRNQRQHETLARGDALAILKTVLNK